jgi:GTP-binding protein
MPKFTDTIKIHIKAGHGGAGAVSFHREKYIAKGGPDGGDGGQGGNVYVTASRSLTNLSHFQPDRVYKAFVGRQGEGGNRHGANGDDLTIKVPLGTEIFHAETNELLADMTRDDLTVMIAKGGRGGKGNAFFKSSTHQLPRFAQPGEPGDEFDVILNLKLIADVGIVGLPNAGKSTFLKNITNAKPKIGDYPFTTLIPNIGVVPDNTGNEITIADIPGIIEGAHKGSGLGLSFLQHIERVKILLFFIDIQDDDIEYTIKLLKNELSSYSEKMLQKPYLVVLTKTDLVDDNAFVNEIISHIKNEKNILAISSHSKANIEVLIEKLKQMINV